MNHDTELSVNLKAHEKSVVNNNHSQCDEISDRESWLIWRQHLFSYDNFSAIDHFNNNVMFYFKRVNKAECPYNDEVP